MEHFPDQPFKTSFAMINEDPVQPKRTWEELVAAAAKETDPEKIANIAEEIFAALEERERTLNDAQAKRSPS